MLEDWTGDGLEDEYGVRQGVEYVKTQNNLGTPFGLVGVKSADGGKRRPCEIAIVGVSRLHWNPELRPNQACQGCGFFEKGWGDASALALSCTGIELWMP